MGLFNIFRKEISFRVEKITRSRSITENLKGEVEKDKLDYLKIGDKHTENYEENEAIIRKFSPVAAGIDKTVDFVVGNGYYITSSSNRAKKICEEFMRKHDFDLLLRTTIRQGLGFGNSYWELTDKLSKLKSIKAWHPKFIYVKRDKNANVNGYTQYFGKLSQPIHFNPDEIAHFKFNVIGQEAYGLSIIEPIRKYIDDNLNMEKIMRKLIERKSGAPLHVKVGSDVFPVSDDGLTAIRDDLQTLDEGNEFVTNHLVEMNAVGFRGKIIDFSPILKHFRNQILAGIQVPEFLYGIAEGSNRSTAAQQMIAFRLRANSIQLAIESVLENVIFRRLLDENGLTDKQIEFNWRLSNEELIEETNKYLKLFDSRMLIPEQIKLDAAKRLNDLYGFENGNITKADLPKVQPPSSPSDDSGNKQGKTADLPAMR